MNNPEMTFYNLVKLCAGILESELQNIGKEQERLESYKKRNPDNILQINSWQELINSRAENTETLQEAILEHFPALLQAHGNRRFIRGREYANGSQSSFTSPIFKNDQHKEAYRHYSIAEQRTKDNI